MLGLQTMLIVGGNTKLIPLTGVTLPLISSGGSSLVSTFLSFGILLGISIDERRGRGARHRAPGASGGGGDVKELRGKMRLVCTLIVCMFIGMAAWYGYTVYSQGSGLGVLTPTTRARAAPPPIWATSPTATRNLLAHTAHDGTRQYLSNESGRRALSQTVGDQLGMSGTGVENYYSSTLTEHLRLAHRQAALRVFRRGARGARAYSSPSTRS